MTTPRTLEEAVEVCAKATFPDMTPSERLAFQAGWNAALESVREEREAAEKLDVAARNYEGSCPADPDTTEEFLEASQELESALTRYRAAKDSR